MVQVLTVLEEREPSATILTATHPQLIDPLLPHHSIHQNMTPLFSFFFSSYLTKLIVGSHKFQLRKGFVWTFCGKAHRTQNYD